MNIKQFIKNELSGWSRCEAAWLFLCSVIIVTLSLYWGDNTIGILAALSGILNVLLTGKGKISCYIVGMVNIVLYAYISFGAKYYGEVMLNLIYYVPMQFVGWFMWKRHMNEETHEVEKTHLKLWQDGVLCVIAVAAIYGYGLILKLLGGNLPFIDSMSTCLSVLAMALSVKRCIEQWILWIIIDAVTVFMWFADYMAGGNDVATLLMWIIYTINGVVIFLKWLPEVRGK